MFPNNFWFTGGSTSLINSARGMELAVEMMEAGGEDTLQDLALTE